MISIYIVIYDMPRCANIWLNFQSRETTLFKARSRRMEGRDLPRFDLTCLVSILPGSQPAQAVGDVEGCPVVELSDSAKDWHYVLKALFQRR
jgi:hypothetical protein